MTLATPTYKGTFMAFLSGSFGAGGSVGLIMKRIMDDFGLELADIFTYWLILYLTIAAIKLIVWTPNELPVKIFTDDEFSIMENSVIIKLCKG